MIIAPSNAIHTFFMKFPIDVVFVGRDGRVRKISEAVRPWPSASFAALSANSTLRSSLRSSFAETAPLGS